MQATSTPTLAQPKSGAFAALGGAAVLAAAVGVGAILGVNLAATAGTVAQNPAVAAYALQVQRSGEIGAMSPAERALLLQRQGEIGAGANSAVRPEIFTTPTGTTIVRIGGRDPMADFNSIGLSQAVSDHDLIRGSKGWYAYPPAVADDATDYPAVPWVAPKGDADGNTQPVGTSHR